jgi:hypothetical protein
MKRPFCKEITGFHQRRLRLQLRRLFGLIIRDKQHLKLPTKMMKKNDINGTIQTMQK